MSADAPIANISFLITMKFNVIDAENNNAHLFIDCKW